MKKGEKRPAPMKRSIARRIIAILDGSFLTRDSMMNNIPYLLFLFGIGIIYIGNSHYAEKNVITIHNLHRELKELRSDFITARSELMFVSKQSEVARAVAPLGIHESTVSPKKIVIAREEELNEK